MSFEEFIEIERTIDVGENDLVPVSIQDDEVSYAFWFQIFHVSAKWQKWSLFLSLWCHQITPIQFWPSIWKRNWLQYWLWLTKWWRNGKHQQKIQLFYLKYVSEVAIRKIRWDSSYQMIIVLMVPSCMALSIQAWSTQIRVSRTKVSREFWEVQNAYSCSGNLTFSDSNRFQKYIIWNDPYSCSGDFQ